MTLNEGEEIKVQKAADDINKAIKTLQDNYAVKDMQDLLAMTALQLASKNVVVEKVVQPADYSAIEAKLEDLNKELDSLK